MNKLQRL